MDDDDMNTCYCVVNFETFWRFTKLSRMNVGQKNSSLTPKKAAKPTENSNYSDACRLCGINCKISVGNKNNQRSFQPFPSPKRNFDTSIFETLAKTSWKNRQNIFSFRVNEKQPPFARTLTPILQDKKQTDDQNQNILQQILLKLTPFWPEPRSDECHFLFRLRVVPLSLSPSCVTRKKFARKKWPLEILGARSARKEGLPPKPKSLPFHGRVIFRCRISHLDVLLLSPVINSPRRSE